MAGDPWTWTCGFCNVREQKNTVHSGDEDGRRGKNNHGPFYEVARVFPQACEAAQNQHDLQQAGDKQLPANASSSCISRPNRCCL